MAQFRGTIQGNRGEASRLGTKNSGLDVTCNGWHGGVSVYARYNKKTGKDEFAIYHTAGSGYGFSKLIGTVCNDEFKPA